jgi:hypothetical protein
MPQIRDRTIDSEREGNLSHRERKERTGVAK